MIEPSSAPPRRGPSFHFALFAALALILISSPGGHAQQPQPAPSSTAQSAPPPSAPAQLKKKPAPTPAQRAQAAGVEPMLFRNDKPGQRERWFYEQRAYPLGYIPFGIRQRAFEARQSMRARERRLGIGSFAPRARTTTVPGAAPPPFPQSIPANPNAWTPIGPQPAVSTAPLNIKQVAGRTSAVAADPTNSNIIYVGGAQGGVWKSIDAGATWAPLTDAQASLATGAIAVDPTNPQIIYVGTGEQTNSGVSYYGAGILKSTDGGNTWTQLGQSTFVGPFGPPPPGFFPGGGARISSLAINPSNPQIILAGVQINTGLADAGVYCSSDGGVNWTQVVSGALGTEVVYDPTPPGNTAYAALGRIAGDAQNGVYRSTNADQPCASQTWVTRNGTGANVIPSGTTAGRIEISIAASSPQILYASVASAANNSFHLAGVFKTIDGGANWTRLAPSDPALGPVGAQTTSTVCSPQCFYDHVIRVHPNNPNVAYLGGAAGAGTGKYFIRTTDGGATWTDVASDGVDRMHVDIQSMGFSFSAGNAVRLFVGNDGGLWSTDVSGGGAGAIDWVNHNGPAAGASNALGMLQFYPNHAIHPGNPDFTIGGTQDNGTQIYTGSLGWREAQVCGDGGSNAIDPGVPTTLYVACQNIQLGKSTDSGTNFFRADGNITTTDSSAFIPPMVLDTNANVAPFARRQLYFGTFRIWRGDSDPNSNAAPTWTAISQDLNSTADVRAIAVSPNDSRIVYAGTQLGSIHRTLDATQFQNWTNVTVAGMLPSRFVTSIAVDPNDPTSNTVYATFSGFRFPSGGDNFGHVFVTTNGGAAWTDISANLPNTPANDILVDPDVAGTLFVATDIGVFFSSNGGVSWATLDPAPTDSLPNVAVMALKLHRPTRLLRAATHGRGMWDLILSNFNPTYAIATISPTGASAGDPNTPLTVTGVGFSATSVVRFNGTNLATNTAGAPTQLQATIPAALLASGQTAQIDVFDPPPAQPPPGTTNGLPFSVTNPAPTLTSISPTQSPTGALGFTLTLNGSNFIGTIGGTPTSQVQWDGSPRTTNATLVSANQITVDIPASDVAAPGLHLVTVFTPGPGGGATAPQTFTVGTPPPNDNFANAIVIGANPFTDTQNNAAATQEPLDPFPQVTTGCPAAFGYPLGPGRDHTIWYRVTPVANVTATADTVGSGYDTVLSVWTGPALGALSSVACDDDGVAAGGASRLTNLALTIGTTYHFMVAGFDPTQAGNTVFNFAIPPDFGVSANPTTVTVTRGQTSAPITVTATPMNGAFASAINFSCTGLPSQSTCVFNPTSLTPGGAAATTTLTITTTAPSMVPGSPLAHRWTPPPVVLPLFTLLMLLAMVLLLGLGLAGKAARPTPAWQVLNFSRGTPAWPIAKGTRAARPACCLAAVVILAALSVSCGGGGGGAPPGPPPNPGTPTGSFTVSVRGASGALVHTTNVTLNVQ